MAPKRKLGPKTGPIPTGWDLKTVVQKDGSRTSMYYCPATGQHFFTYFELMRYVEYAMREGLSIYEPCCKSVKRLKSLEKERAAPTNTRKTSSILSLRKKPSAESKSSIVEQSVDSRLPTSSESSDKEKDEDYVPESETNVSGPDFK